MTRTLSVLTLVLAGLASGQTGAAAADRADAPDRPNIVFVLVDDMRWDSFGAAGHPFVKTPHIDRLAREGMTFKNFFVTLPLCSPARSSFLTGQYAHTTGVTNNSDHGALSHRLDTFPRRLDEAGYDTAYVGKWHMGTDDTPRPGFDRWVSFKGQGVYENPPLNIDGERITANGYMTDILNDYAVQFVRQPHEKPFLLYLSHKAVHGPFTPADRHKDLYTDAEVPPTPNLLDTLEGKPALKHYLQEAPAARPNAANRRRQQPQNGGAGAVRTMRLQLAAIGAIDDGVGLLYDALAETGALDRTLFVFTSDNGYLWGEHTLGDKRAAYEESIRDPLVVRYPPLVKAGSTRDEMVLNIDLAPTMLELAGAPVPDTIQGQSLVPLLAGREVDWRQSFLAEYFREARFGRIPTWQAVRTPDWKYIDYTELDGMNELYHLSEDPYEMHNLIDDPAAREDLARLQAELAKLRIETGADQPSER